MRFFVTGKLCLFQGMFLVEKKKKYMYSWQDVIRDMKVV